MSIWTRRAASRKPPGVAVAFSRLIDKFWITKRGCVYGECLSTAQIASFLDKGASVTVIEGPFNSREKANVCIDAMWESP